MSITIKDLLQLPSLTQAEVIAGNKGLSHIVSSISVLEYAQPSCLQDELFQHNEFQGGEIVISALISIKEDVEAQCACIKRLHEAGEVGLILYYVGIFLPDIDERLIKLADALSFPLICMPKHRMDLRYSEVIQEVMEWILKDRKEDTYIVVDMLDRIAALPAHQRSMDSVLRLLSDRFHASYYLIDSSYHVLNEAAWPKKANIEWETLLPIIIKQSIREGMVSHQINDHQLYLTQVPIYNEGNTMALWIIKENAIIEADLLKQMQEILQLFVNIWSQQHGAVRHEELIRAILNDEPAKMRRLADILNISVSEIHSMWVIKTMNTTQKQQTLLTLQRLSEEFLHQHYQLVISSIMEDTLVIFMAEEIIKGNEGILKDLFVEELHQHALHALVCGSYTLVDTTSVRHAYMDIQTYLETAVQLYPKHTYLSLKEVQYAKQVRQHIDEGEEHIQNILSILQFTARDEHQKQELLDTLAAYLLDGDMRMQKTAELLFVHKNTVKYRIHLLQEKLHSPIDKLPEALDYYLACALRRLL